MDNNQNSATNPLSNFSQITSTSTSTSTSTYGNWNFPIRLDVIETDKSIEMIYKETSIISLTSLPQRPPEERVFKIIFSCVDGVWNKSDRIYGDIIPAKKESYTFDEFKICICKKPTELYTPHLGDGGYEWCMKCDNVVTNKNK